MKLSWCVEVTKSFLPRLIKSTLLQSHEGRYPSYLCLEVFPANNLAFSMGHKLKSFLHEAIQSTFLLSQCTLFVYHVAKNLISETFVD